VLRNGVINLTFTRAFGIAEDFEWEELIKVVERVATSQQPDSVTWILEKSGEFSTSSLYKFSTSSLYKEITFPGMENKWMLNIWQADLPLKIIFFLWKVCNDKIQFAEQLRKRN
jgi:hypothetical protein